MEGSHSEAPVAYERERGEYYNADWRVRREHDSRGIFLFALTSLALH